MKLLLGGRALMKNVKPRGETKRGLVWTAEYEENLDVRCSNSTWRFYQHRLWTSMSQKEAPTK